MNCVLRVLPIADRPILSRRTAFRAIVTDLESPAHRR
jgi:hypothetical protein